MYVSKRPDISATRPPLQAARLLDQLRERLRYLHYSLRTEQSYVHWVKAFVRWSGMRHLRELGKADEPMSVLVKLWVPLTK